MHPDKLRAAIVEAKRFLDRAERLMALQDALRMTTHYVTDFPKEQGGVRRASMDLTRALAEMRGRT